MEFEFMTADTVSAALYATSHRHAAAAGPAAPQRSCMPAYWTPPLRKVRRIPTGYCFVRFPIVELAAALSRSSVTVKRSLKELEDAGLILRVAPGRGRTEPHLHAAPQEGGMP